MTFISNEKLDQDGDILMKIIWSTKTFETYYLSDMPKFYYMISVEDMKSVLWICNENLC